MSSMLHAPLRSLTLFAAVGLLPNLAHSAFIEEKAPEPTVQAPAQVIATPVPVLQPVLSPAPAQVIPVQAVAPPVTPAPALAPQPQLVAFDAVLPDGNVRRVLSRWATLAGWTFAPEHWAAPVDIPLSGEATFGTDFMEAVTQLLEATALGKAPLAPCFYSNKVLRVVPAPQMCDRTAGGA